MERSKFNFYLGLTHESLWGLGFGFMQPMTILPLALTDLGGSAGAAGLLAGIFTAGSGLLQAVSALTLSPSWTDPKRLSLLHAPGILGTFLTAFVFFFPPADPTLHRLLFLGACAWFFIGIGIVIPHWMVAAGRCIDPKIQGRYFGMSFFLQGLLGAFSSRLAASWAGEGGLRWGYGLAFLSAALFQSLSAFLIGFWRPARGAPTPRREAVGPFLRNLLEPRERKAWGLFALLSVFLIAMTAPSGLFTVDLTQTRGATKILFEWLAPAFSIGLMAGALAMGLISDRQSPRTAFVTAILGALLGLVGIHFFSAGMMQVFSYFGAGYSTNLTVVCMVVALGLSGKKHPTVKIGILNTVLTPAQFLLPLWAGALAQEYGYGWSYALAALAALAAAFFLLPNALWRTYRSIKKT
jgi:MFS family permease